MQQTIPSSRSLLAALAAICAMAVMAIPAAAQGTPEQRAACQGDAQRLCGQFIPDVDRITACMVQHRRYLSQACRMTVESGRKGARALD